jgi:hypothetical protein
MTIDVPAIYRSSPLYAVMLNGIDHALAQHQPSNVRAEEIIVTGEAECVCIVLMPHHQLGGVALIVWSDVSGVQLRWGRVTTLRRHDEIDLATSVGQPIAVDDATQIAGAISVEMVRPIRVQFRPRKLGKPRLECSLEIDGRTAVIGRLTFEGQARFEGELITTLGQGSMPFEVAVPLGELRDPP